MSEYIASITWERDGQPFLNNRYSRLHHWQFDGGIRLRASSSPHVVPLPMSVSDAVDPEEALVASLSSCHMLWFLSIAAQHKFCVDDYQDNAVGTMGVNQAGKTAMLKVALCPQVRFSGEKQPTADEYEQLHKLAHDACYIAHSVNFPVECQPRIG
ncbi:MULTISPECIES: OsmC family protein [unclassified Brenneria]|uniref:OsmC family protein n=1 Tax=unclassified Brenneria TaxID=2634434 RepID=UPI001556790A|nr:OsmC family protein [Brenneria sp. HEZEL_4_2_4]NPD00421.1 OsmC family peroxiredoxin [Brenneria sp. hezel4-2-4]